MGRNLKLREKESAPIFSVEQFNAGGRKATNDGLLPLAVLDNVALTVSIKNCGRRGDARFARLSQMAAVVGGLETQGGARTF